MDLWQLNIFRKVVELQSFSKAGQSINLSQPTVSSHIRELESYFGCRLIDRMRKAALPTDAGRLLYDYSVKLLALRDEAESAVVQFQGKVEGPLVVGGSTIPGGYILPKIVGQFGRLYPDAKMALHLGDSKHIVDDTLSGKLDLGVVGAKVRNQKIMQEKLLDDQMQLIVPAEHKWANKKSVTVKALVKEPFVMREEGSGTRRAILDSLEKKGFHIDDINVIVEMGSAEAVREAVKSRIGVSILSTIAVADEIKAGRLKALKVEGVDLSRSFYLTLHRYRTPSPVCHVFIQYLKTNLLKLDT
jgi:DNA-binding transcriptional LysR family regulator